MTAKRNRLLWLLSPVVILVAVAASVLAWPHLPERVVVHWGFSGEASPPAPRVVAAVALPAVMVWVGGLMALILWSATRSSDRPVPGWIAPAATAATLGMLCLIHLAILGYGLGLPVSVQAAANVGVGLLLIGAGRIMPLVPQNAAIGIRTPRTLSDADAWERANRAGGRAFVAAGIVTVLSAPLPGVWPLVVMMIAVVAASIAAFRAARAD